jgi:hypothetical protein
LSEEHYQLVKNNRFVWAGKNSMYMPFFLLFFIVCPPLRNLVEYRNDLILDGHMGRVNRCSFVHSLFSMPSAIGVVDLLLNEGVWKLFVDAIFYIFIVKEISSIQDILVHLVLLMVHRVFLLLVLFKI